MTKASEMNKPPEPATPQELEAALVATVLNSTGAKQMKDDVWKIVFSHIKTLANHPEYLNKATTQGGDA